MIRAAFGLLTNFVSWCVFGFVGLLALDGLIPGAGFRVIEGVIATGAILADSVPAGVLAGLLFLVPAYYLGNRVTVDRIYADNQRKIDADRERYTL